MGEVSSNAVRLLSVTAELPQGHPRGCHQYDDGRCGVQHEALDEQECLVFFCDLAEDAGRTPRECVI